MISAIGSDVATWLLLRHRTTCTAGHTVPGWSYSGSQLPGATLLRTRSIFGIRAAARPPQATSRTLGHVSGRGTNNEAIVPTAQPSAGALVRWACRSDTGLEWAAWR